MILINDAISGVWKEEYEDFIQEQGFEWDEKNRVFNLKINKYDFFISFAEMYIESYIYKNMECHSIIQKAYYRQFKPTKFFEEYNDLIDWIVESQNQ